MKLFYYKDEVGNFGDDLNPWLWDKLLPDFFDDDDSEILVGIGTLINHKLPKEPIKHFLGSGFGYGDMPKIDDKFIFHAVRGPKTAEALGIDPKFAITDSAILIRNVEVPKADKKEYKFGFIPHYQSSRYYPWETLAEELGFNYICTEWDVERILIEMSKCEVLICEAMHGAIVADALRIPWIPVYCYDYISVFKWQDWLATLELEYKPYRITSLFDAERNLSSKDKFKNKIKRTLKLIGLWRENWHPPAPKNTQNKARQEALKELKHASTLNQYLSSDAICEKLTKQYTDLLEKIKVELKR